ncbi:MAG: hypothetical protein ACI4F4_02185 [Lachnospiraceae bacterium]
MVKNIIKYIVTFFFVTFLLTILLVLSAMIPQTAIKAHVEESARYLCDKELFGCVIEGIESSKIDRYADSILLGIAYQYDSNKPLASVMESAYYHRASYNENENLLEAVTNSCEANQQYLRYWHGSNVIVRPLLMIFNVKQIYVFNGILLVLFLFGQFATLLRNHEYVLMIGVAAGLIMTSVWFVPFSLEYTWTVLLMLVMSMIGALLMKQKKYNRVGLLFLVGGMLTCYLDFLSTETLTLTVPLLIMLWMEGKQKTQEDTKSTFRLAGTSIISWGFGYAGMWIMKWILASVVLSKNVMPYVSKHMEERISGNIGVRPIQYIWGAIWNNVKCLFPFEYGIIGALVGLSLVLFVIYTGYVYHGQHVNKKRILMYVFIGLIPYFRYVVLHNHSYLHYFFTYRAQMAMVVAVVMILEELVKEKSERNRKLKR